MKVNKLILSNFRSFRHLDIALDDHFYLLTTVFDTTYRPKAIDDELHRLFKRIKTELDTARALLDDLRVKIDGASPDLVKAETLLRRYEIIGK